MTDTVRDATYDVLRSVGVTTSGCHPGASGARVRAGPLRTPVAGGTMAAA